MDVLENVICGCSDFTTWLAHLLSNWLLLKPKDSGDHQKQCSCLTSLESLGPMLHILEPSWEWIHAATSTSKVSVDMSPISPRFFPKCPMHAEFMRWTWDVLLRVLKKNMPAVRLKLQIGGYSPYWIMLFCVYYMQLFTLCLMDILFSNLIRTTLEYSTSKNMHVCLQSVRVRVCIQNM